MPLNPGGAPAAQLPFTLGWDYYQPAPSFTGWQDWRWVRSDSVAVSSAASGTSVTLLAGSSGVLTAANALWGVLTNITPGARNGQQAVISAITPGSNDVLTLYGTGFATTPLANDTLQLNRYTTGSGANATNAGAPPALVQGTSYFPTYNTSTTGGVSPQAELAQELSQIIAGGQAARLLRVWCPIDCFMTPQLPSSGAYSYNGLEPTTVGNLLDLLGQCASYGVRCVLVLGDPAGSGKPYTFQCAALDGTNPTWQSGYISAVTDLCQQLELDARARRAIAAIDLMNECAFFLGDPTSGYFNTLARLQKWDGTHVAEGFADCTTSGAPDQTKVENNVITPWIAALLAAARKGSMAFPYTVSISAGASGILSTTQATRVRYEQMHPVDVYDLHVYSDTPANFSPALAALANELPAGWYCGEIGGATGQARNYNGNDPTTQAIHAAWLQLLPQYGCQAMCLESRATAMSAPSGYQSWALTPTGVQYQQLAARQTARDRPGLFRSPIGPEMLRSQFSAFADDALGIATQLGIPSAVPLFNFTAAITGGRMEAGSRYYSMTYLTPSGESILGPNVGPVTVASGVAGSVSLTSLPTGAAGVTMRGLYRTKVGVNTLGPYQLVAILPDNTSTTYTDILSDKELGRPAPSFATFRDWTQVTGGLVIAGGGGAGLVVVGGPSIHRGHHQWYDPYHVPTYTALNAGITSVSTAVSGSTLTSDNRLTINFTTGATPPAANTDLFTLNFGAAHSFPMSIAMSWGNLGASVVPPGILYLSASTVSLITVRCSAALAASTTYQLMWVGVS